MTEKKKRPEAKGKSRAVPRRKATSRPSEAEAQESTESTETSLAGSTELITEQPDQIKDAGLAAVEGEEEKTEVGPGFSTAASGAPSVQPDADDSAPAAPTAPQALEPGADYTVYCYFDRLARHYVAGVFEFPDVKASGVTREAAVALIKDRLTNQVDEIVDRGDALPYPIFTKQYPDALEIHPSQTLYRRLDMLSRQERTSLDQLVIELLTAAMARKASGQRPQSQGAGQPPAHRQERGHDRGMDRGHRSNRDQRDHRDPRDSDRGPDRGYPRDAARDSGARDVGRDPARDSDRGNDRGPDRHHARGHGGQDRGGHGYREQGGGGRSHGQNRRHGGGQGHGGPRQMRGRQYQDTMNKPENFLEYVRSLEAGGNATQNNWKKR